MTPANTYTHARIHTLFRGYPNSRTHDKWTVEPRGTSRYAWEVTNINVLDIDSNSQGLSDIHVFTHNHATLIRTCTIHMIVAEMTSLLTTRTFVNSLKCIFRHMISDYSWRNAWIGRRLRERELKPSSSSIASRRNWNHMSGNAFEWIHEGSCRMQARAPPPSCTSSSKHRKLIEGSCARDLLMDVTSTRCLTWVDVTWSLGMTICGRCRNESSRRRHVHSQQTLRRGNID